MRWIVLSHPVISTNSASNDYHEPSLRHEFAKNEEVEPKAVEGIISWENVSLLLERTTGFKKSLVLIPLKL